MEVPGEDFFGFLFFVVVCWVVICLLSDICYLLFVICSYLLVVG